MKFENTIRYAVEIQLFSQFASTTKLALMSVQNLQSYCFEHTIKMFWFGIHRNAVRKCFPCLQFNKKGGNLYPLSDCYNAWLKKACLEPPWPAFGTFRRHPGYIIKYCLFLTLFHQDACVKYGSCTACSTSLASDFIDILCGKAYGADGAAVSNLVS